MLNAKPIPGNTNPLTALRNVSSRGFLNFTGDMWHTYGDLSMINLGLRKFALAIHPEAVRYISQTNRQNYDKLDSYEPTRRYLLGNGVLTSTGDLWRRQRKLMAPFYTPRAVNAYADLMLREGQAIIPRWEALANDQPCDVMDEMTIITAAIILKSMFSMDSTAEVNHVKDAVNTMIGYTTQRQNLPINLPLWVPTKTNQSYIRSRKIMTDYINGLIAQRRTLPEADYPRDLLSQLMLAKDEETQHTMSESLLRDETITIFMAGHETTARTMTFLWYALATNPEVEARLDAELQTLPEDRAVTVEDLHRLPYALQVIKETLRLYPAAPFYVRDAVADDTIDGYAVPKGTAIMLSPYYTHRHPDFWENPLQFDPDRWTPERERAQHPYAFHPFASGQRVCIGNNFSLLETHILLALLAKRFRLTLAPGFTPQWASAGTLGTRNGMQVIIHKRAV